MEGVSSKRPLPIKKWCITCTDEFLVQRPPASISEAYDYFYSAANDLWDKCKHRKAKKHMSAIISILRDNCLIPIISFYNLSEYRYAVLDREQFVALSFYRNIVFSVQFVYNVPNDNFHTAIVPTRKLPKNTISQEIAKELLDNLLSEIANLTSKDEVLIEKAVQVVSFLYEKSEPWDVLIQLRDVLVAVILEMSTPCKASVNQIRRILYDLDDTSQSDLALRSEYLYPKDSTPLLNYISIAAYQQTMLELVQGGFSCNLKSPDLLLGALSTWTSRTGLDEGLHEILKELYRQCIEDTVITMDDIMRVVAANKCLSAAVYFRDLIKDKKIESTSDDLLCVLMTIINLTK